MPRIAADSPEAASIDAKLAEWMQGDVMFGETVFVHAADPRNSLTDDLDAESDTELVTVETIVPGVVVLTQTCDLVRKCVERSFVEISPLVELESDAQVDEVRKGLRPGLLFVPALSERRLVVDLDRTMTVEKPVVATWPRIAGCKTDEQRRALAQALARKRARNAFPDDFTAHVQKLARRIKDKHRKNSDEGRVLSAMREIRVSASPEWGAAEVALMFWFILHEELEDAAEPEHITRAQRCVGEWLGLVSVAGRFIKVDGMAASLSEMTAAEYVNSDALDLDYLSWRGRPAGDER